MISRVKRSKFWRWLARGAPVLALMLVLLGSVLVQTALATDPPDLSGGDTSFYMMSSIGAGYLNDTLAKVGMGDSETTAVDVTQAAAGGLLGYCDALDESGIFSKWLHSQFSNSAVSFSHETFRRLMGSSYGGSAGGVGAMAESMYAYCKYGQLLSTLGFDTAGESGSHPIRWLVGFLMRIAYTVAIFVPRLFIMLVGILRVINPFRFFNVSSNLFRIDALEADRDGNNYLASPYADSGTGVALKSTESGLSYVASVLTTIYGFLYEHLTIVILTIAFVILVTNLIFSSNKNAFKKIKAYVMRLVVMFLIVPLCAMIYTDTLNTLDKDLNIGLSYGTTRIVMSTFMDFESWASTYNLKVPTSGVADLKLNTATNRPQGTTILNLRTSCYNLNAKSWGVRRFDELLASGASPMDLIGSRDSFFPQQSLSTSASNMGASDSVNNFNSSARTTPKTGEDVTEMVYDLLERYQNGTFYYSSSYESEFKAAHKNQVDKILETVKKSGKTVSDFRTNANDLIGSGSTDIVWSRSGDLCTMSSNIYDFSNSAGLSPMAMYNYLSSSFDEANVKVYSNEKSSSGFIRDSHFSVNLIGTSALDRCLYFFNALALLGCVAVLGIGYALAVIFCNIKRSFLMFPEIITTTFGSLRAGARLVGHTLLLIVEVVVTILVYMVSCEFLMAINDLICTDMIRGLTATAVGGALIAGASLSAVIVVSLILSTVMLIIFVIMALKVRKTIVKTIDEAVTSLIDRLFGVQHIPEPDTPGLGGRAAGALAAGAGAGLANRMMNGDSSNQNARGTAVADDAGSDGGGGDGNGGGGNGGDGDGDGSEEATKVSEGEEAAAQADADGVEPADADSLGTDDMPSGTMSESEDSATSEDKQTAEELAESDSLDGAAVAGGAAVGAAVAGGDDGDSKSGEAGGSGTAPEAVKDNDSVDSNSDSESSESSETQKEVAGGADENGKSDDGDESEDGDGDSDGDDKSEGGDKNQQTKNAQPGDGNTPKKNNQNGSKHKNADGKKTGKPGDKSGSDKKDGSGDKKDDQGGDSNGDNIKNAQPGDKADASDVKKAAAIGAATGTAAAAAANAKNAQEGDKAGGGSDDKSGGSGENSGGSGDKQGGSDDKSGGDSGTKPVVENADTNGGSDKSGGDKGGGSGGGSGGTAPANSNNGGGNAETAPNGESDGDTDKSGGDGDKSDGDGGESNGGTRNAVPNADSNGAPTAPGSRAGTKQLGGTAAQVAAAQAAAAAAAAGTVTTAPNGSADKPGENQNGGSGENSGGGSGEKQSGGSGENSGGASTRPVVNAGGENQSGGSGEKQPSGSGEKQSGGSDDKKNGGNAGGANSNNSGGNGGNSGGGNARTKPLETTGGSGSGSGSIEHGESHGSGPSDVERSEPIPKSPDPAAPSSGGNNANTTPASGGSGSNQQQSGGNAGGGQGGNMQNQQSGGGQGDGVRNARSAPSGQNQQPGSNQNQQQGGARTVRQSGGQNQQSGGNNGAVGHGQNRAPSGNNQNQQQGGGARTVRQSGGQNQQHGGSQGGGSGQRAQAQSGAQGGQSTVHQTQSENPAPRQQGGQSGQVAQGSPNGRRVSGPQPNSGRPSQSRVIGAAVVGSFLQSSNNKIVSEMGRGMNRAAEIEMYQNRGTQAQNRNQAQNQNRPGTNTTDTHSDTEKKELEDKATDVIRTNKKNQPPRKPPAKKKVLNINPGKVKDYGPSKKPGDKPDGDDAGKRQKPEREDPKKRPETRPDTSGGAGSNGAPPPPPGGDDDDMLF